MDKAKPFQISKWVVWYAYKRIKENKGTAGIDEETIADFERDIKNNLYKIWNRMSSGTYFPFPVRLVEIPKSNGGKRSLGIPTVSDRIAQMVVKMYLEPLVEPYFHKDSYGYRPRKSAIEAVGKARERCWRNNWVIDLDIKGFFDNINHELMMKAVKKHTDCKWMLLYIERWLKAAMQKQDGSQIIRDKGTPQGSVISPLLANLFLHYAFDVWMQRKYPDIPFERYADDIIAHGKTQKQAEELKEAIRERLAQCGLELHPEKTKIVYCKDDDRKENYSIISFDFLGYTFRPRRSKNRWGKFFINFSPAVSNKAIRKMCKEVRIWRLQTRSDKTLEDLSSMFNPKIRGWINYFSKYYKSALYPVMRHINDILAKWAIRKYKTLRRHRRRGRYWLGRIAKREPNLFAHWKIGVLPTAG